MAFSSLLRAALILTSLPLLNAYAIDLRSCQGPQLALIETAIEAAFDMAAAAQAALHADKPELRDPNVERLINLLFGNTADLTTVDKSFTGLEARRTRLDLQNDKDDLEEQAEMMFYCNMDRFEFRGDLVGPTARWIDTDTNKYFDDDESRSVTECKSGKDITLAYTISFEKRIDMKGGRIVGQTDTPAQITLCPWFIEWATNAPYSTFSTAVKAKLARALIPLSAQNPFNYPLAPVDAYGLLEKVILHELTHTLAGGKSDDVSLSMIQGGLPFAGVAYGWRAATNLVEQQATGDRSPTKNADSLALFASGVRLLNLTPPKYVERDGGLSGTVPLVKKRSLPHELAYQSTPVVFEGFITKIKEARSAATSVVIEDDMSQVVPGIVSH
ncbi:unnamed protein product [Zymoseptoria tritici ST99CH_1A5]|uniref:Lysine-specific metallo-endopeptidase domain-containing protein n=1 Tax=Zymoseptoria tritici ST99CH_1A5 TaxID=1276529 RepID=A0A1Y6L8R0_ZYMTR|nr:unnamed protein product [Zymoseptoria tritici ST99CH_1A5]